MKANSNVTITATLGDFVTKARRVWRALCERGVVWLKSDKKDADDRGDVGILLDTPSSSTRIEVGKDFDVLGVHNESTLNLITNGGVTIQGYKDITISTTSKLILNGDSSVLIPTYLLESSAYRVNFGGSFSISGGRVAATVFSSDVLQAAQSIQGPRRTRGADGHLNHVDVYSSSIFTAQDVTIPAPPKLTTATPWDDRIWAFTADVYISASAKCETYAQQYANTQNGAPYADVDIAEEGLLENRYTQANSTPWPGGSKARILKHRGGEALTTPSEDDYSEVTVKATDFNAAGYTFRKWVD